MADVDASAAAGASPSVIGVMILWMIVSSIIGTSVSRRLIGSGVHDLGTFPINHRRPPTCDLTRSCVCSSDDSFLPA